MTDLSGKRILVVEDEFLVALEAASMLAEVGATVVGPAYHPAPALQFAKTEALDAAVLDINLGTGTSESIADTLKSRGIPFIFATGYGQLAGVDPDAVVIDKPYSQAQIVAALRHVLA
ncbi:MAG: response regulator [Devosia sp.]|uniref:response regulator n=1 Tax=Devosia sp. TaxID=1871048 RepID=UPI001AD39BD8|nr:response regulator [Devosia sp.]MBN9315247.1 response regulator [Devosia sp.]